MISVHVTSYTVTSYTVTSSVPVSSMKKPSVCGFLSRNQSDADEDLPFEGSSFDNSSALIV